MSTSDTDELSVGFVADDQLSATIGELDQATIDAAASMSDAWESAAAAAAPIGDAVKGAAEETKQSASEMVDAIEEIPEAAEDAAGRTSAAMHGMGSAAHDASESIGHMAGGHGILQTLAHRAHEAHTGLSAMKLGARLAKSDTEQLAHSVAGLSTRLIGAVAAGNYFVAGVMLASTAVGLFAEKSKEAEKEEKERIKEIGDEIKKMTSEATKNAEQAANEQKSIAKSLADARITSIQVEDNAIQTSYKKAVATERARFDETMKLLEEKQAKNEELLKESNALLSKAATPEQKTEANKAIASAEKAKAEIAISIEMEKQISALRQQEALNQRNLAYAKEDLEIRKRSADVLSKLGVEREKGLQSLEQEIRQKAYLLTLSETDRQYASELQRIEDLKRQGLTLQASELEKLLQLKKAIAIQEKDVETIRQRALAEPVLRRDAQKEIRDQEKLNELRKEGYSDEQVSLYERERKIRDDILELQKQGLEFSDAEQLYRIKINALLDEEKRKKELIARANLRSIEDLVNRSYRMANDLAAQERMATLIERGNTAAVFGMREQIRLQDEFNAKYDLYTEYQRKINDEAKLGHDNTVRALQEEYRLELKILETKHQETEQEKIHNDLLAAGQKISGKGATGTHADKGLASGWQARNRKHREEKLYKSAQAQAASFGGGDIPVPDDGDFTRIGHPKDNNGDMGVHGKMRHSGEEVPDTLFPTVPKAPDNVKVPALVEGQTGDNTGSWKAQLDIAVAKLQEMYRQHNEMAAAMGTIGKHLENTTNSSQAMKSAADSTKESANKLKEEIAKAAKAFEEMSKKIGDMANADGPAIAKLMADADATKKKIDTLLKQLSDLQKAGG